MDSAVIAQHRVSNFVKVLRLPVTAVNIARDLIVLHAPPIQINDIIYEYKIL